MNIAEAMTLLGIVAGASEDETKRAFRRLAQRTHPDRPGGSADKFREAVEAFETLTDPKRQHEPGASAREIDAITPEMLKERTHAENFGVCSVCAGEGEVIVAVGRIGYQKRKCPKCGVN